MNLEIVYLYTSLTGEEVSADLARYYKWTASRFCDSFIKYCSSSANSRLVVVATGGEPLDGNFVDLLADHGPQYFHYNGTGRDIGAFRAYASRTSADYLMLLGSACYFWCEDVIDRTFDCLVTNEDSVIAPMASYEVRPHLRTCCFATKASILRSYPYPTNSISEVYDFEHGPRSLTNWAINVGLTPLMYTLGDEFRLEEWRDPPNVFRRGDQTNCVIWDRHVDIYRSASEETKVELEGRANGRN